MTITTFIAAKHTQRTWMPCRDVIPQSCDQLRGSSTNHAMVASRMSLTNSTRDYLAHCSSGFLEMNLSFLISQSIFPSWEARSAGLSSLPCDSVKLTAVLISRLWNVPTRLNKPVASFVVSSAAECEVTGWTTKHPNNRALGHSPPYNSFTLNQGNGISVNTGPSSEAWER